MTVSILAKDSSLKEITNAGNFLIFISSAFITTYWRFFAFFIIGRPFEGIVIACASLVLEFHHIYFDRSSIGYIDTDILNLFFIYFLFATIYFASKKQFG